MGEERQLYAYIHRYPDEYTVIGTAVGVRPAASVARDLVRSGFMADWLVDKVVEAMERGEVFKYIKNRGSDEDAKWIGREDHVVAEYRLATDEEVGKYLRPESARDQEQPIEGEQPRGRKISDRAYELYYQDTPELVDFYTALPAQARTILEILNENIHHAPEKNGHVVYSEVVINDLLVQNTDRLRTKQPPLAVFSFYRSRYLKEGHLKELK